MQPVADLMSKTFEEPVRRYDTKSAAQLAVVAAIGSLVLSGCAHAGSSDLSKVLLDAILKNVFGGLAVFLFGMDIMTDALRSVAGASLRKFIEKVAGNRITALAVGTVVTGVIQSSSAFSLMVLAMIEAHLIRLSQALPMLFGANIGTTFTGWLFAWNVTKYGLTLIGAGYFGSLTFQKLGRIPDAEKGSRFLLGLGLVFLGLTIMSAGFKDPTVTDALRRFFSTMTGTGHLAVAKCIISGAIATAVVQSSSATLGIVIALAHLRVITFETAIGLILGLNIGTTVTAGLALLRGRTTVESKRVALAHFMFNVLGAFAIWVLIGPFTSGVEALSRFFEVQDTAKKVAVAHTTFNVTFSVLFTIVMGPFQALLLRIIRDPAQDPEDYLAVLKPKLLQEEPEIAIEASRTVLIGMSLTIAQMFGLLEEVVGAQAHHQRQIGELEKKLDRCQKSTGKWFTQLKTKHFGLHVSKEINRQQRIVNELESIGDSIDYIVTKLSELERSRGYVVDREVRASLLLVNQETVDYVAPFILALKQSKFAGWKDARQERRRLLTYIEGHQDQSIDLVQKQTHRTAESQPEEASSNETRTLGSEIVADIFDVYRSYRDIIMAGENIAKALAGKKY
jgi:phosphate:Na+ symporter